MATDTTCSIPDELAKNRTNAYAPQSPNDRFQEQKHQAETTRASDSSFSTSPAESNRKTNRRLSKSANNTRIKKQEGKAKNRVTFPIRLYQMLEDVAEKGFGSIVSWQPSGNGFMIHNHASFVEKVLPLYFNQSNVRSFQRQLSYWEFKRVLKGPQRGAYVHPKFNRSQPEAIKRISRLKCKGQATRKQGVRISLKHHAADLDEAVMSLAKAELEGLDQLNGSPARSNSSSSLSSGDEQQEKIDKEAKNSPDHPEKEDSDSLSCCGTTPSLKHNDQPTTSKDKNMGHVGTYQSCHEQGPAIIIPTRDETPPPPSTEELLQYPFLLEGEQTPCSLQHNYSVHDSSSYHFSNHKSQRTSHPIVMQVNDDMVSASLPYWLPPHHHRPTYYYKGGSNNQGGYNFHQQPQSGLAMTRAPSFVSPRRVSAMGNGKSYKEALDSLDSLYSVLLEAEKHVARLRNLEQYVDHNSNIHIDIDECGGENALENPSFIVPSGSMEMDDAIDDDIIETTRV